MAVSWSTKVARHLCGFVVAVYVCISLAYVCLRNASPRKAVGLIGGVDDSPEAVSDADKDADDQRLANPFWQRPV
jgi:hypothetical protein